jgi:hypothetical protein
VGVNDVDGKILIVQQESSGLTTGGRDYSTRGHFHDTPARYLSAPHSVTNPNFKANDALSGQGVFEKWQLADSPFTIQLPPHARHVYILLFFSTCHYLIAAEFGILEGSSLPLPSSQHETPEFPIANAPSISVAGLRP